MWARKNDVDVRAKVQLIFWLIIGLRERNISLLRSICRNIASGHEQKGRQTDRRSKVRKQAKSNRFTREDNNDVEEDGEEEGKRRSFVFYIANKSHLRRTRRRQQDEKKGKEKEREKEELAVERITNPYSSFCQYRQTTSSDRERQLSDNKYRHRWNRCVRQRFSAAQHRRKSNDDSRVNFHFASVDTRRWSFFRGHEKNSMRSSTICSLAHGRRHEMGWSSFY